MEAGVLTATADDFVRATIRQGEQAVGVRLRLKGDSIRPLLDGQWSFPVKLTAR